MEEASRTRQIITIIIIVLVLSLTAFFLYRFLTPSAPVPAERPARSIFGRLPIIGGRLGPEVPTPLAEDILAPSTIPPSAERRRIVQITDEPIIGPALDAKRQKILYYKKRDGHLIANSFTGGAEETISNLTILNIVEVVWSPDQKRAVVIYQDGDLVKKFIAEATSTPKVAFLPQETASPAWSPDAKTLFWLQPEARPLGFQRQNQSYTLVSSGPDGKSQRSRGFTSPIPDLGLHLLNAELAAITPKTISFFETPLFLLNLRTLAQNTLMVHFGMTVAGDNDPTAQFLTYSPTNRVGAMQDLHTLDVKTGKDTSWPVKTVAEKCAFASKAARLFCAVPRTPPERDLPESWFQGKISFSDTIVRMDLGTGKAEQVFDEGDYDATSLVIADDGKRVFFIDKKTGFLYSLALE